MQFRKTRPMENKPKSGLGDVCPSPLPINFRMAWKATMPSPDPGKVFYKGLPATPIHTHTSSPLPECSE